MGAVGHPTRDTGARRGRPPRIDHDTIVAAGLDLGITAVSMRKVAQRLGVTDAALYHHFPSRDALLAAMVDALAARFELPRGMPSWRRWLRAFADRLRASVLVAPGSAEVLARLGPATPGTRKIVEAVVQRLIVSGFGLEEAALAYSLVTTYVVTSAARQEVLTDIASYGAKLSLREHGDSAPEPSALFHRILAVWREQSWDAHFAYGIERILDGIAASRTAGAKRAGRRDTS